MTTSNDRSPVQFRQATRDDLDAVVTLERAAQVLPWTRAALLEEIDNESAAVDVAVDQDLAGTFTSMVITRRMLDEVWILQVGTRATSRMRGLARELLQRAISRARSDDAQSMWLEVRASNSNAISLYRALGFEEVARRRRYYAPLPSPTFDQAQAKTRPPTHAEREDACVFSLVLG